MHVPTQRQRLACNLNMCNDFQREKSLKVLGLSQESDIAYCLYHVQDELGRSLFHFLPFSSCPYPLPVSSCRPWVRTIDTLTLPQLLYEKKRLASLSKEADLM